jgi:hypothetical protein
MLARDWRTARPPKAAIDADMNGRISLGEAPG